MHSYTMRGVSEAVRALATRRVDIECDRLPHRFEAAPLRKVLNWIRVEASLRAKSRAPWGWPTHLMVEPTNHCNLRCRLCPVTDGMIRPSGFMSAVIFEKLIEELSGYLFLILFWNWGEPFLHPSIFEMISLARRKGVKTICSTNGSLLVNGDNAAKTVRSGLDTLIVAVDGATQETYESYRVGGDLERVFEGLRMLVAKRREYGSRNPLINLRFMAMKHNEHEIPEMKRLAESLGVDVLSIKTLNPCHKSASGRDEIEERLIEDLLPHSARYRRFKEGLPGGRLRHEDNPCKNLWNNPVVQWDGSIVPCTYDYNSGYVLGDLNSQSFREIWQGEPYRRLRYRFRSAWERMVLCQGCSYAYPGGGYRDEVAEVFYFSSSLPFRGGGDETCRAEGRLRGSAP